MAVPAVPVAPALVQEHRLQSTCSPSWNFCTFCIIAQYPLVDAWRLVSVPDSSRTAVREESGTPRLY